MQAGFHVICEKPMTMTHSEALELQKATAREWGYFRPYALPITGYPMVRQMKAMIAEGVIGEIQKIDAQYYQGWINPLIHDKEQRATTWRTKP